MTADEITELFIAAAEIDRRIPDTSRPAQMKSMNLPYVADWADMAGWGSERLEEERREFWGNVAKRLNPADMTLWERANDLVRVVDNVDQRRALLHWAIAKAGGRPFSKWCRAEGIQRETGRKRKDRAVFCIFMHVSGVTGNLTHETTGLKDLPNHPENGDKKPTIEKSRSWMAEGSRPLMCDFDYSLTEFVWADEQNARRRKREAKREAA